MSKLSPALKALVNAPFARAGTTPAPKQIRNVYERIARQAEERKVEVPMWLTMSTAATMTMNSPASLSVLHALASAEKPLPIAVQNAELMREVGLKCIGFNGIPRTINSLGAFTASLPPSILPLLTQTPTREPTPENISSTKARGLGVWTSIYRPFDTKLIEKLALSHPDLPVHILSEYGLLFADPPREKVAGREVGRILTSVVAVACLRAQTGVGPQVISHLFGLRKAVEAGEAEGDGVRWLASDEGGVWMLESVDRIVEAIGGGEGTTFAPGRAVKL
ncbi:hypothetical protein P154DRAFT_498764 [Amniculicola lignicola CBS 123094]|uniref:Mitochondrial protein n=1 Tax=Amniculicola lignicola CBS 123094 TaxID=1392246 RepID=A0A6A5WB80_9PLEO|nr:hypothetical protein P154DRAFT_498764 [Amniculicola lignicola CBS 123094]